MGPTQHQLDTGIFLGRWGCPCCPSFSEVLSPRSETPHSQASLWGTRGSVSPNLSVSHTLLQDRDSIRVTAKRTEEVKRRDWENRGEEMRGGESEGRGRDGERHS